MYLPLKYVRLLLEILFLPANYILQAYPNYRPSLFPFNRWIIVRKFININKSGRIPYERCEESECKMAMADITDTN